MSVGIAVGYFQVTTGNEVLAQVSALQSVALKKIKLKIKLKILNFFKVTYTVLALSIPINKE